MMVDRPLAEETLCAAGIDVGSSAVKVAIVETVPEGGDRVLASVAERIRRRDPIQVAREAFAAACGDAGMAREGLAYVATTGEGEMIDFRTGHFYGMTTHARGALFLDREARAVVDIGALHTRALIMDGRAKVLAHRMTSQCASGSGQFLENIARYLGVTLEEIGPLSLSGDRPETCSSICAVLAETDVINMVSRGITIPNILRGIHESMAGRVLRLLTAAGARGVVMITGGLAADVGLIGALRSAAAAQKTPLEIRSHRVSALAGAIGAALWGAFRARRLAGRSSSLAAGSDAGRAA
ncbi:MAG TPA: benzoyl-CoA reductase subunit D [Candidatus Polarisedimenticolia bacterium]|nr:benzoyl-CoA reductase subunit D [Candidatus Polarisedimenticolia bacterium]